MSRSFPTHTDMPSKAVRPNGRSFEVISVVASRHLPALLHRRSKAIFRPWREGTDPASRGTNGRQEAAAAGGAA